MKCYRRSVFKDICSMWNIDETFLACLKSAFLQWLFFELTPKHPLSILRWQMRIHPHHQFFEFSYSIQYVGSFTEPWVCRFFAFCFQKLFPTFGNFDNFRSNSRKLIVDYLKIAGFEFLPTSKVEIEKSVWHLMNHPRILISEIYSPNVFWIDLQYCGYEIVPLWASFSAN